MNNKSKNDKDKQDDKKDEPDKVVDMEKERIRLQWKKLFAWLDKQPKL